MDECFRQQEAGGQSREKSRRWDTGRGAGRERRRRSPPGGDGNRGEERGASSAKPKWPPELRDPARAFLPGRRSSTRPPSTRSCLGPVTAGSGCFPPGTQPREGGSRPPGMPARPLITARQTQALPRTASGHSELSQGRPLLRG